MKNLAFSATVCVVLFAASSAMAAICVQVDEERDNLQAGDREAIKTLVEESLRNQDQEVSRTNCDETYTIYSLKLGNSVRAHITGPKGSISQKANGLEDLPDTYDQLVRSLLSGDTRAMSGMDRSNVTKAQAAPRRVIADSLLYMRLGYGAITGGNFASGPAFGLGYRYELDQFGMEISGFNFISTTDQVRNKDIGWSGSWIRLGGLYFFDPLANHSPFLNLGLSWASTTVAEGKGNSAMGYSGSGLQGEIAGGYEFFRASTIRFFVEASVMLPFYTATADFDDQIRDSIYTPSFSLSLGGGYGAANRSAVEVY